MLTLLKRDLWLHKHETLLVLLALILSVFTLMTLLFTRWLLVSNLALAAAATPHPDALLRVTGLEAAHVAPLQTLPGVAHLVAGRDVTLRMQYGGELWYALNLQARSDLTAPGLSPFTLEHGAWPTEDALAGAVPLTLALEMSAQRVSAVRVGELVQVYHDDYGTHRVPVVGMIYDPAATPSHFQSNTLQGFTSLAALSAFTGQTGYAWLALQFDAALSDTERAEALAGVEAWLQQAGVSHSPRSVVPEGQLLVRFTELALALLGVLALMGLLLCMLWISNVMTTRMARAQLQIGIMKALGFQRSQIALLYLGQALLLGLVATCIALGLSYGAAHLLSYLVSTELFVKPLRTRSIPLALWGVGLGLGLGLPLLATGYPIGRATAITVREALGRGPGQEQSEDLSIAAKDRRGAQRSALPSPLSHNVGEGAGGEGHLAHPKRPSVAARFAAAKDRSGAQKTAWHARFSNDHSAYIGRNLLRHKLRVGLTIATLTLAGMMVVTTSSLNAALERSLAQMMAYWLADVRFATAAPVGAYLVRNEALALPGVAALEARLHFKSVRQRPDGSTSPRQINLVGLPPDSSLIQPTLLAGRWLRDDDLHSVVIDREFLRMEPDLAVGDWVTLDVRGEAQSWQIVGIVTSQLLGYSLTESAVAYTRYHYLSEVSGYSGQANFFLVQTSAATPAAQIDVAQRIETQLHRYRFSPVVMETYTSRLQTAQQIFGMLILLVQALSLLFALVGGLSLINLMSLNVLERRREIGMIRAMGGTRGTLAGLIGGEALLVSLLSAAAALLLAWPLSWLLCREAGMLLVYHPLPYRYSGTGALAWLLLSGGFSWLSSSLALRQVAQGPVRMHWG